MHFSITEGYNIWLRQYETAKVEITAGGTHYDMGVSDGELSLMSDNELEVLEGELKIWIREQMWMELKPWLVKTSSLADDTENNTAALLLRSHSTKGSQHASTPNNPKPARA